MAADESQFSHAICMVQKGNILSLENIPIKRDQNKLQGRGHVS